MRRMKLKRGTAGKAPGKLAGALMALGSVSPTSGSVPPTPGPSSEATGPLPSTGIDAEPPMPPAGATDGLGAGQGGLAIHPSLKGHNIGGYESRHTSKTR
jgi:hypothetical protein